MSRSEQATREAIQDGVMVRAMIGGPGTGKTKALVGHAADLVAGGVEPSRLVVFCASPVARDAMRTRLAEALAERGLGESAREIEVLTVREFALDLLGSDDAGAFTGRDARILTDYETNVMLEDLKTCGLRPKRLKEMLKFFYRGWTEMADDDPTWLYLEEEQMVYGLLVECLDGMRGMLEPEVANLAVRYLRYDADVRASWARDHVLVDDYQALSRASQQLVGMVARSELWAAGDPVATAPVFESYPYGEGLDALTTRADEVVRLGTHGGETRGVPREVGRALDGLVRGIARAEREAAALAALEAGEGAGGDTVAQAAGSSELVEPADAESAARADAEALEPASGEGGLAVEALAGPAEEAELVVARVRESIGRGVPAGEIFVATPSRAWASRYERLLEAAGIPVARRYEGHGLGGDMRDLARCVPARILTLIRLAQVDDPAAWRCWCGFGDWLLNSPAFSALRRRRLGGTRLAPTLDHLTADADDDQAVGERIDALLGSDLAADERASMLRVCEAYRIGRDLAGRLAGLSGADLAQAAADLVQGGKGSPIPAAVTEALDLGSCTDGADHDSADPASADSGIDALIATARARLAGTCGFDSADHAGAGAVRVGSLEDVVGTRPRLLVVCGMVNGFMPSHAYFDDVMTSPERRFRMRAQDLRRLYAALGCTVDKALLTSFTGVEASRAQALGLKVDRYRMAGDQRMARVSPSVILEDLEG